MRRSPVLLVLAFLAASLQSTAYSQDAALVKAQKEQMERMEKRIADLQKENENLRKEIRRAGGTGEDGIPGGAGKGDGGNY